MEEFTSQHLAQAWRMHELGLRPPAEPGVYVLARAGSTAADLATPLPGSVHLIVWPDEFRESIGGQEAWDRDLAWLPTWEQGRVWLTSRGVPVKHVYYVVKEGVMFYGEDERFLLYEEIARILMIDGTNDGPPAATPEN